MIHSGLLRHPLTFRNPTKTPKSSGGSDESYSDFYSTRGYFRQLTGSSILESGIHVNVQTYEAYVYWRAELQDNINNDTRIVYDGREFKIDNAERIDEDRRFYKFQLSVVT